MRETVVKRFLIHVLGSGASSCVSTYTTRHLAERIRRPFPENVYDAIRKRLYVDDGQESGSTLPEALQLKRYLIDAMAKGGISLSKWKANHPALLHQEPGEPAPIWEDKMEKGTRKWRLARVVARVVVRVVARVVQVVRSSPKYVKPRFGLLTQNSSYGIE